MSGNGNIVFRCPKSRQFVQHWTDGESYGGKDSLSARELSRLRKDALREPQARTSCSGTKTNERCIQLHAIVSERSQASRAIALPANPCSRATWV